MIVVMFPPVQKENVSRRDLLEQSSEKVEKGMRHPEWEINQIFLAVCFESKLYIIRKDPKT